MTAKVLPRTMASSLARVLPGSSGASVVASLPLTSTLASYGATLSFARASTSSVIDYLGAIHITKSGEARFHGARRTENLCAHSEDFVTGWTTSPGVDAPVSIAGVSSRTGRESIKFINRTSGGSNLITRNSSVYRPGRHTFSINLATVNGTDTIRLRIERSSDSASMGQIDVVPPLYVGPGSLQTFSVSADILDATNHRFIVTNGASGLAQIYLDGALIQYTHGRPTDAPDDYVAIGVDSSPWYGANVDGVKYWNTTNGNTVTAGSVTFGAGTGIAEGTLKGLVLERGSVNGLYSSRDFNTAQWSLIGVTAGSLADSVTLGSLSLRKMAEDTSTGSHRVSQVYRTTSPADNTRMTVSCFAKKAERDIIRMGFINKAGTVHMAYFNLTTGTVSDITGSTETEAMMYPVGDCYRLVLTGGAGVGATVGEMIVGVAQTAGSSSHTGVSGSGAYVGGFQFEPIFVATAYKGDTGTSTTLTSNSDNAYFGASVIPTTQWEIGCDFTPYYKTATNNKPSWVYIWYSNADQNNRFGLAIRPGLFGGFTDAGSNDFVYDHYYNDDESTWDGVDLINGAEDMQPLDTRRFINQLHTTAVNGASNLLGRIGSTNMASTSGGTRGVNLTPTTTYIRFGINESNPATTGTMYHSYALKNFYVYDRPVLSI